MTRNARVDHPKLKRKCFDKRRHACSSSYFSLLSYSPYMRERKRDENTETASATQTVWKTTCSTNIYVYKSAPSIVFFFIFHHYLRALCFYIRILIVALIILSVWLSFFIIITTITMIIVWVSTYTICRFVCLCVWLLFFSFFFIYRKVHLNSNVYVYLDG